MDKLYKNKYLKYKNKYLTLQNQLGGTGNGTRIDTRIDTDIKELIIKNANNIIKDIDQYSINYKDSIIMNNNVIDILKNIIQILQTNSTLELKTVNKFHTDINNLFKLNDSYYDKYNNIRPNIITNSKSLISFYNSLISKPPVPINYNIVESKLIKSGNKFIQFIGAGGFGCVFSPPTLITPIVKQEYPPGDQINIDNYNGDFVAKILSCEQGVYDKEYKSNILIKKFDKNNDYTPAMIFAGYMIRKDLMDFIEIEIQIQKQKQKQKNINTELIELYNCLYDKLQKNIHDYYGYIISTKVGKSCDKLTINDINKYNIKEVLTSYSVAIKYFINKLYEKKYLHGDIKIPNMTLKGSKIYFIDFGFTDEYDNILKGKYIVYNYPIVVSRSVNYNYPIILHLFTILYNTERPLFTTNKTGYKILLNDIIRNLHSYKQLSNVINTLIVSHKYSIFKNIKDVQEYLKDYINKLLDLLNENQYYTKNEVYKICFSPIARNVDIYSLSLVMFHLFYNNIYQDKFILTDLVPDTTLKSISNLFKDALNNQIENPIVLADRLDNIIKTIN